MLNLASKSVLGYTSSIMDSVEEARHELVDDRDEGLCVDRGVETVPSRGLGK